VLLEALACGRPVVTTQTAARGLGEKPAQSMLLLDDPQDDKKLADQIRAACENTSVRKSLCDGARGSIEHFFLERTQAHEVACYRRVLQMHAQGDFQRNILDDAALWMLNLGRRIERILRRQR
jgi:glycosyltransferase involved in cell wall biosynthesis